MSAATFERAPGPAAPAETILKRKLPIKRMLIGGAVLATIAGGADYGHDWWTTGRFLESTDDAYVGGDVTVMAPRVSGFITQVAVTDNQPVKAGDLLVGIDDRPYRAELARTEANVAAQEATLADLDANRHLQEAVLLGAKADRDAAEAETARSAFDFDRYKALATDEYASRQRFEQADADHKKAMAAVARADAAVEAAARKFDVIDAQKKQTLAALDVARAERDAARLNLGYTEIRAPIDGVIGNRSARVGGYAATGAALLSVVPAKALWVDANFKENQLATMRAGESATVEADVLPGQVFTGHIASLAPATGAQFSVLPPENATGNFTKIVQRVPVRITLDGSGGTFGQLRPGLSVTATVDRRGTASGHGAMEWGVTP